MIKTAALIFALLIVSNALFSQSIVGKWKTIDDETGKAKSVVEIYKSGNKYFGKVVQILNPAKKNSKCIECKDSRKDQPVMGMEIIKDLEYDADDKEYDDGTILDPANGKIYDCKVWLENSKTLNVRGYVAFFYRTQVWLKAD